MATSPTADYDIEVPVLIVGAGPAGLTATLLLHRLGVEALTVTRYRWTANTPRAHYQNQRAIEVMRELGLEDEVIEQGTSDDLMRNYVWASSLAGVEFARLPTYMASRRDEYAEASPCRSSNIPQHILEPILAQAAMKRGAPIRWHHEFVGMQGDAEGVTAEVLDRSTGKTLRIRARCLLGADGGRSKVAELAGIPFTGPSGFATAVNVWFRADLTPYCAHRPGVLYIINRPGNKFWNGSGIFVIVKPWNEWVLSFMYDPAHGTPDTSEAAMIEKVRDLTGDPHLQVTILAASQWQMNAQVADTMVAGRVFLAGDAAHRHPPTNGLGSNTSIQDAYNLAWKLKLVLDRAAGPGLLQTYNQERRPVAQQVIDRSMQSIQELAAIAAAIGFSGEQTEAEGWQAYAEVSAPTPVGKSKREALRKAIDLQQFHMCSHGVELGFRYGAGAIVPEPDSLAIRDSWRDRQLVYEPSTAPGAHLPHAWLEHNGKAISTLDLAGYGSFLLIVGHEGAPWKLAAEHAASHFHIPLVTAAIGFGLDYLDTTGRWQTLREVGDGGCLLVRPDKFIAWRSLNMPADPQQALTDTFAHILAR